MKIIKRLIIITIILMMIASLDYVKASFKINKADLYSKGRCETLFYDRNTNAPILVTKVFYNDGINEYPAYCLNMELDGVGEIGGYSVDANEALSNVQIWRAITNGYPYKSLAELGVASEDEAYAATKQAVYCILYGFDEDDFWKYEPVGEAGERALNAMKQIVYIARNSGNSKPSSNINISEIDNLWSIDSIDSKFISKRFRVSSDVGIKGVNVELSGDLLDGTKVVDLDNNDKNSFDANEDFKVLIPVRNLEKSGNFNIKVNGEVATRPIIYGNSNNSSTQDYALTGDSYEIGEGNLTVQYNKNTSKLIIKKQEKDTENQLAGAEFRILDSDLNIIYDGVKVNEEGIAIIDGIFPGDYFLEETKAPNGYERFIGKIDFKVDLNEEVELIVNNSKKTIIEKEYKSSIVKLPKTGM